MELEKLRAQLKSQLQQHQVLIQQIKTDPQNPDLQKKLQSLQAHITSLSEQQSHVVKQLRQELINKTELRTEENTMKSPLGDNNSSNITSLESKESTFPVNKPLIKLEPSTKMELPIKTEPVDVKPVKLVQPQKPLPIQLPRIKPKPPPVVIVSSQHGNIEFSGQSVSPVHMGSAVFTTVKSVQSQVGNPIRVPTHYQPNNKARPGAIRYSGRPFTSHHLQPILPRPAIENKFTPPQNFNKQPEKPLEPKKMEFMAALGLITPQTLIELQLKRQERKRRSNCISPQNALEIDPEPKRIKKITMLPVKRGRGRPPKFSSSSAPNSPNPSSPVPNGYTENGKHKKFKYKRFITGDSPADEDDNHDEVCEICRESGELLLCDTCNLVYHMSCLDPPLTAVPPGMWLCPKCKEKVKDDEPMPWPGTLAVVHSYLAHKTAKEEEKNKLLKRSEELKAERVELEAKAKELSNAIMEQMQAKSELSASNKSAQNSVDRLIKFIELVQSL
ncbi:unnamed protein product [Porites lobata]|uniref:PHD-type domain-containing protein n=1 Tax=Porites lobata TaxID=104759 RepID=A0ABN8QSH6_9CNID|nr:unnamed protein product [Porites lobata]